MEHENRRHRDHGDYSLALGRACNPGTHAAISGAAYCMRKLTPGPPTSLARLEHGTL